MRDRKKMGSVWSGLDLDSHLSKVGKQGLSFPGAYVDGRNFVLYADKDGNAGIPRKFKGTRSVPFNAPAGVNTGIGTYWDETGDTLIAFIHNSQGNHFILWNFPNEASARVIQIPQLNLQIDKPVVGCVFVNRELLAFTDGATYPKMINLPKADNTGKRNKINVYFPPSSVLVDQRTVTFQVFENGIASTATVSPLPALSTREVRDFTPMITKLALQWNNSPILSAKFHAHACGEVLELEAVNVGEFTVTASFIDIINSSVRPVVNCITEFTNRYNAPFTSEQIRLSKVAPLNEPAVSMAYDPKHKGNSIQGNVLQFQYAVIFSDKSRSLTSRISDIALPVQTNCSVSTGESNCVDIDFDFEWLNNISMRGEISHVNLFYKEGNDGAWFMFQTLEKWEWMYDRTFRFYKDGVYSPSDNAYNIQGNTNVPPIAKALEIICDAFDNTRLVLGGLDEGDDNPCVDISVSARVNPSTQSSGTATLVGKVKIRNGLDTDTRFKLEQPIIVYDNAVGPVVGGMGITDHVPDPESWNQRIPLGGFVIYAAGTDLIGITRQTWPTVSVSGGSNRPSLWAPPTGSHAANRNVYDGLSAGDHPFNAPADVSRASVRNAIKAGAVWQEFSIPGLIPGQTYVFRMASNLCDYDTGDIYDLNSPGREYQNTSGNVWQFGTITNANVTPSRYECTVTVPLNGAGTTIDIGDIDWYDTTNPKPLSGSWCNQGYLYDANGVAVDGTGGPNDIRKRGIPAERQLVAFRRFITSTGIPISGTVSDADAVNSPPFQDDLRDGFSYTDHNGFFFMWGTNLLGESIRAVWLGVGGTPGIGGSISSWGSGTITVANYAVANDISDTKLEGNISDPTLAAVSLNLFSGNGARFYIFPNRSNSIQLFIRTRIVARMVTPTLTPVAGVKATLQWGRTVESDVNGNIELIAYGDVLFNNDDRTRDSIIFRFSGPCTATFAVGNIFPVSITQFQVGANFGDLFPRTYGDLTVTLTASGSGRGFGRGSSIGVGYYLTRTNGDRTAVKPIGKLRMPESGQDLNEWDPFIYPSTVPVFIQGLCAIDYSIGSEVPIPWIGRWEALVLVMTYDLSREWYVQWMASSVTYSTIWNNTDSKPTPTNSTNSNATEIYISVTDSFTRYAWMESASMSNQADSSIGYLWEEGDRVKIITDDSQQPLEVVIDVNITAQRGQWIVIKSDSSVSIELKAGMVIEIYRPRKAAESEYQPYYDVPGGIIPITGRDGTSPTWSTLSGTIANGPAWTIPRAVPIKPNESDPWTVRQYVFESAWIWDDYKSLDYGKGKPWFEDPYAAKQHRGNYMRYSDSFKPGTNINGLNFFHGLNIRNVENWLGDIIVLIRIGDVVMGICQNGAFSVYVGIEQLQTTPDSIVQTAGGILGTVRPFAHKFGCIDPLSVERGTTNILYFCRTTGSIVQYNSNALQDLAEQNNCSSYFQQKSQTIPDGTNICAGYDMVRKEFIFSFASHIYNDGFNQIEIDGESIKYHDPSNKFIAKMDFPPDVWGKTRQRVFSFHEGGLWEHYATNLYNDVYGQDVPMKLATPFVPDEWVILTWKAVAARLRGAGWEASLVYNIEGQESLVPDQYITDGRKEGWFGFSLLRDANDPDPNVTNPLHNGAEMRSTEIVIELSHHGNEDAQILALNAAFNESPVEP